MKHRIEQFESVAQVFNYINELVKSGLDYHFDDNALECLSNKLTEAECIIVQHNVGNLCDYCDELSICPFTILIGCRGAS